jgi:hypothetical protein
MAQHKTDRDDLMEEATALVRRVEFRVPFLNKPIVAGFKRSGAWSVYFAADPVFQFDAEGRLRRAYVDGSLFRTQGSTVARLERAHTSDETILLRHDLTDREWFAFRERMHGQLSQLHAAMENGFAEPLRQIPELDDVMSDVRDSLRGVLDTGVPLAQTIAGRR